MRVLLLHQRVLPTHWPRRRSRHRLLIVISNVGLTIAYASATKKYKAKLQGLGAGTETFVRGKQYSYTLKISDGVLTMTGNEIKEWETGNNVGEIVINGEE